MNPLESLDNTADTQAALRIHTLGGFRIWRSGQEIPPTAWGREKALHVFQFLLTHRRGAFHKEQIIDQLWPELDLEAGDRDFKVALNAIYKAIEPDRPARAQSRFIQRFGLAYRMNMEHIWVDADAFEAEFSAGSQVQSSDLNVARRHFRAAIAFYQGDYLPERRYEDWTSIERERLQSLALSVMTTSAELSLNEAPLESLRLAQ